MKCLNPECKKEVGKWRAKAGYLTCSKKCSHYWNWLPSKKREEIRGKKYNHEKTE